MKAPKFQNSWGELSGEKFTRLPKGVEEGTKGAEYLWQKQFIVSRNLTRKEVISADFSHQLASQLIAGAPFLKWLRDTVGVYEKDRAA